MTHYMEPNTPEWLEALEAGDRLQATLTKQLLAAAGGRYVCSLCGSVPAKDYWVVARKTDPTPVPTLRLCEGCVDARACVYNQKLVPLEDDEITPTNQRS